MSILSKFSCLLSRNSRIFARDSRLFVKPFRRGASSLVHESNVKSRSVVGWWLIGCSGMVFAAVSIGGLTRLTESGLSIVDWKLIKGMKPPMNEDEWLAEFAKYQQYPEFAHKGGDKMSLEQFKFTFYMEYLHRMWGRAIGVAYILPATWFWYRGYFTSALKKRVLAAGGLLMFQGLLGWYMVKSGLDPSTYSDGQTPRVSQYRLAAHLTSAFVLYAILLRAGLIHLFPTYDHSAVAGIGRLRALSHSTKGLLFLTAVAGAFVAGLDAGWVYNSWPKYADRWLPHDMWSLKPTWRNFTDNPVMAQFIHRNLAYLTLLSASATWLAGRRLPLSPRARIALHAFGLMGYAQVSLGIAALVHHTPVWMASLHQNGFMIFLTTAIWLTTEIRRLPVK